jgi:hypothetical protein
VHEHSDPESSPAGQYLLYKLHGDKDLGASYTSIATLPETLEDCDQLVRVDVPSMRVVPERILDIYTSTFRARS